MNTRGAVVVGALLTVAALAYALALCFWLLMAALLIPVVYSLLLYKRLEREGEA